jgi:hypothetical protein
MPLHDWDDACGWDGVRHFWITHLFHWVKPRLPANYRAYVGSVPALRGRLETGICSRWADGYPVGHGRTEALPQ